jgi:selenocysteine lyase/cysteine desulfurase
MDVREARSLFPGLKDKIFLDTAVISLLPAPASRAVQNILDLTGEMRGANASSLHVELDGRRRAAVSSVARLIGASQDEIALVESTSHGLSVAAASLPLRRGDEVIIPDTEFLQVAIPWAKLAEERGVRLKFLENHKGAFYPHDFEAAMGRRTKVIALSSVQWSSGFKADLKAIGRLCRARKVYLVVDAIQQVGADRFDVRETPVDFVACGGHKWLNAPLGCGFLYIRKRLLKTLRPPFHGYLGLKEPRGGWLQYFQTPTITPNRAYRFPSSAQTFELGGTANYPGAVALKASVDLVNAIGIEQVAEHIQALVDRFIEGLDRLGLRLVSPRARKCRAGIVSFRAHRSPQEDAALVEKLAAGKIFVSARYTSRVGGIRVSVHYFNNEEDIDGLLDALRELK